MSKPINVRLTEVHQALLEKSVERLTEKGVGTNKTDVIQKAIYSFARSLLNEKEITQIIDKYYK